MHLKPTKFILMQPMLILVGAAANLHLPPWRIQFIFIHRGCIAYPMVIIIIHTINNIMLSGPCQMCIVVMLGILQMSGGVVLAQLLYRFPDVAL